MVMAAGAALALSGCGSGKSSSSELASNEAMTISVASQQPAKQRGLIMASDSLGRVVFADEAPAIASVPDQDR